MAWHSCRLPGGLSFIEAALVIHSILATGKAVGISVTIFNPLLDKDGIIAQAITDMLSDASSQLQITYTDEIYFSPHIILHNSFITRTN